MHSLEEKRQAILFLILVTLSSVKSVNFAFSMSVHKDVLFAERMFEGNTASEEVFTSNDFLNLDHECDWCRVFDVDNDGHTIESPLYLDPVKEEDVQTAFVNAGTPLWLYEICIEFKSVPKMEIIVGILTVTVFNFSARGMPMAHFTTHMFSPAQTEADEKYSQEVAIKLNPLTQDQVNIISREDNIKFNLSSLVQILTNPAIKLDVPNTTEKFYTLKSIIVDDRLMQQYFRLAHPNGRVQEMHLPNNHRYHRVSTEKFLQNRELGGRPGWRLKTRKGKGPQWEPRS